MQRAAIPVTTIYNAWSDWAMGDPRDPFSVDDVFYGDMGISEDA